MVRFYFDTEFTNGNYYLGDIIEVALLAEESGNTFHSYVQIHYLIPTRVKELTNISDALLVTAGCKFKDTMVAFLDFIRREQLESDTPPIIIAHGGFLFDFPLLLSNCMKYGVVDHGLLPDCLFLDSIEMFKALGYQKPGLDSLCNKFGLVRQDHSALFDVQLLCRVFKEHSILYKYNMNSENWIKCNGQSCKYEDLLFYLHQKLPVSIQKINNLARRSRSKTDLEVFLSKFVKNKTALNTNQLFKIAHWYFKDRFIMKNCISINSFPDQRIKKL